MIKFFQKIRQNLLSEGKTKTYVKYAIGEIVLVIIGILIALQINNWNEDRKLQNEVLDIYGQIILEMDNDIAELEDNLQMFESLEPMFNEVLSDNRTVDMLDEGLSRLITVSPRTSLNTSGVNRLKSISANDSLSLRVIEIYDQAETVNIIPIENRISQEQASLANKYRDNYSWYPEWISKRITKDNSSPELQYFFVNSQEYRHYVISSYQQIYNNYLPSLRTGIPGLKEIRNELQLKIEKK